MNARKALVALIGLLLICGCSKPEAKYVGHFNGKMNIAPETQAKLAQQSPQFAQAMANATFALNLKQDMTFSLTTTMMGQGVTNTGVWSLTNGQIVMTSKPGGGAPGETPSKLTPSADGNTLTALNTADNKSTLTFTRG